MEGKYALNHKELIGKHALSIGVQLPGLLAFEIVFSG
jgi:hypothetical protein